MLESHRTEIEQLQRRYRAHGTHRFTLGINIAMPSQARVAATQLCQEVLDMFQGVSIAARCPRCQDEQARGVADTGVCGTCPGGVLRDCLADIVEVHAGVDYRPHVGIEYTMSGGWAIGVYTHHENPTEDAPLDPGRPGGEGPAPLPVVVMNATAPWGDRVRFRVILEIGLVPRLERATTDMLGAERWDRDDNPRMIAEILAESVTRTLELLDHRTPDGYVLGGPRQAVLGVDGRPLIVIDLGDLPRSPD